MLFPDMFLSILVFSSFIFIFSIIVPVILDAFDLVQFDSTIPLTYIIGFITIRYKRIYIPEYGYFYTRYVKSEGIIYLYRQNPFALIKIGEIYYDNNMDYVKDTIVRLVKKNNNGKIVKGDEYSNWDGMIIDDGGEKNILENSQRKIKKR